MSTYVIGDIHGCYDDLMRLFDMLELSSNDRVYFVGDYIDRGRQNLEMLRFIESRPGSFHMIQGNHDLISEMPYFERFECSGRECIPGEWA